MPVLLALWVKWDRNQFFKKSPESWTVGHTHSSLLFPSWGRSHKLGTFSLSLWTVLASSWSGWRYSGAATSQQALLFSSAPTHPKYTGSLSAFWIRWAETSPLCNPSKTRILEKCYILLFPSQGRSCKLGFFSWLYSAVPAWGKVWCG